MIVNGSVLFSNLRELITNGKYSEAFNYLRENESINKEESQKIDCIKALLGCVVNRYDVSCIEIIQGFNNTDEFNLPIDTSKIQAKLDCCQEVLGELINLCKEA